MRHLASTQLPARQEVGFPGELSVADDSALIGWWQWYRLADYPAEPAATGAAHGEVGIGHAIGEPSNRRMAFYRLPGR